MQRVEPRQFSLSAYRISLTKGASNAGQCDGYQNCHANLKAS